MQKSALQLAVSACSHTGHVRAANQDAYGYSVEGGCFAVCDGMGGAAGGEVASRITIETLVERLALAGQRESLENGPAPGPAHAPNHASASSNSAPARRIEQAVAAANRILYTRAQREPALHGMGTTLVALVLSESAGTHAEDRATIAHVGDSRCYLLRGGMLRRCTEDHSLVEEQVRLGQMTAEEAAVSPLRHVITRAVGVGKAVSVEMDELAIESGDLFLLCTDGLTREIDEARLAGLLVALHGEASRGERPAGELAQALVAEALRTPAADNITCLTVLVR